MSTTFQRRAIHKLDRTVAFGYRTGELKLANLLPSIPEVSESLKIKIRKNGHSLATRSVAMVSAGVHVINCALPRPDFFDPESVADGISKRFGHKPPEFNPTIMRELIEFNKKFVKRFTPIPAEEQFSFSEWLDSTHYPGWRKAEIVEAQARLREMETRGDHMKALRRVSSFIKDESYPTWKYPRPINSRSDEFKVAVGPAFRVMEKVVFQDSSYIKKIPRDEWPRFVKESITSEYFMYISDYSSYESLFEELMELELDLYRWMLQYHPRQLEYVEMINDDNYFHFKHVKGKVWRKRMSGEMNTSLGNGYTTNVVHHFLSHKYYGRDAIILQEGDDTLYASAGPMSPSMYSDVGLEVKLERVTDLSVAQFCQLIFDDHDLLVVRDPIQYLVGFSWISAFYTSTSRFDRLMLDCKALSALSQYPGHPIIQSFAFWIRRVIDTEAGKLERFVEGRREIDSYQREKILAAISSGKVSKAKLVSDLTPVPDGTRRLVERRFGVLIEAQLAIEHYFDSQTELHPVPFDVVGQWVDLSWVSYNDFYVRTLNVRDSSYAACSVGPTALGNS